MIEGKVKTGNEWGKGRCSGIRKGWAGSLVCFTYNANPPPSSPNAIAMPCGCVLFNASYQYASQFIKTIHLVFVENQKLDYSIYNLKTHMWLLALFIRGQREGGWYSYWIRRVCLLSIPLTQKLQTDILQVWEYTRVGRDLASCRDELAGLFALHFITLHHITLRCIALRKMYPPVTSHTVIHVGHLLAHHYTSCNEGVRQSKPGRCKGGSL